MAEILGLALQGRIPAGRLFQRSPTEKRADAVRAVCAKHAEEKRKQHSRCMNLWQLMDNTEREKEEERVGKQNI